MVPLRTRPISECSTTTDVSPLQPFTTKQRSEASTLQKERPEQLSGYKISLFPSATGEPPSDVTSDPESLSGGSNAPGRLGESAATSKRSGTRPNYQTGPARNQTYLERAQRHHRETGRPAHDEQQQKPEIFTGLKGSAALQAYREKMDEGVRDAAAN